MTRPSSIRSLAGLAAFAGLVAAAGVIGARSTERSRRSLWYRRLRKSRLQPPDRAFGPVWTALFALIAGSGLRVWRAHAPGRSRALALWGAQLALNAGWSYLFFARRRPRLALAELALLFASIAAYMASARKVDRTAAWMMAPYLGWVGFAGLLNEEIVRKNPPALLEA